MWACARHRGLRVKKLQLSKDHPWKDAEKDSKISMSQILFYFLNVSDKLCWALLETAKVVVPGITASKVVEQLKMLKNQSCRNQLYDADDVWHTDEHRKRELESSDSWWFSLSSGPSAEPSTSSTLVTTVIT